MKRVLVVDDANFMRLKISKVLKDHGFKLPVRLEMKRGS